MLALNVSVVVVFIRAGMTYVFFVFFDFFLSVGVSLCLKSSDIITIGFKEPLEKEMIDPLQY